MMQVGLILGLVEVLPNCDKQVFQLPVTAATLSEAPWM